MTQEQPRAALDFGDAIRALKAGHRVSRAGWNGKGMWLILAASSIAAVREHGQEKHNRLVMLPHIVMKTAQAHYVPWLASQTDMLADDWVDLDAAEQGAAPTAKRYTEADIAYLERCYGHEIHARMTDGRPVKAVISQFVSGHQHEHRFAIERVLAVANGEAS